MTQYEKSEMTDAQRRVLADFKRDMVHESLTSYAALKARAEAAEGLLREAREMLDNGRECDDCGPSVTDLKRRIDAALQAARESTEPKGS